MMGRFAHFRLEGFKVVVCATPYAVLLLKLIFVADRVVAWQPHLGLGLGISDLAGRRWRWRRRTQLNMPER